MPPPAPSHSANAEPQIVETEVGHRAGNHADVVSKLRPDENECGARQHVLIDAGQTLRARIFELLQPTDNAPGQIPILLASPGLGENLKRRERDRRQRTIRLQLQTGVRKGDRRKTRAVLVESGKTSVLRPFATAGTIGFRVDTGFVRAEIDDSANLLGG